METRHSERPGVISVDPATKSGWALVTAEARPDLIATGILDMRRKNHRSHVEVVQSIQDTAKQHHVVIIGSVVEDQYLHEKVKNWNTMKVVARNSGMWAGALEFCLGSQPAYVQASVWQSKVLKGIRSKGRPSREDLKRAAQAFCKLVFKAELTQDEADAACLGFYDVTLRRSQILKRR